MNVGIVYTFNAVREEEALLLLFYFNLYMKNFLLLLFFNTETYLENILFLLVINICNYVENMFYIMFNATKIKNKNAIQFEYLKTAKISNTCIINIFTKMLELLRFIYIFIFLEE